MLSTIFSKVRPDGSLEVGAGGTAGAFTGTFVDYAEHVEFGTSRSPAQPFIRPAGLKQRGILS